MITEFVLRKNLQEPQETFFTELIQKKSITFNDTSWSSYNSLSFRYYLKNTKGNFLCIPPVFAGLVNKSNRTLITLENELPFFLELDKTTQEQNSICSKITVRW